MCRPVPIFKQWNRKEFDLHWDWYAEGRKGTGNEDVVYPLTTTLIGSYYIYIIVTISTTGSIDLCAKN